MLAGMLLAEHLLLLSTDPGGRKPTFALRDLLPTGLAGALLLEMVIQGDLAVSSADADPRDTSLVLISRPQFDDPMLARVASYLSEAPVSARTAVGVLRVPTQVLYARMSEESLVRKRNRPMHEFVTRARWEIVEQKEHTELRDKISVVLLDGKKGDTRTSALLSLLAAMRATQYIVHKPIDRETLNSWSERLMFALWAEHAIRPAVRAILTATQQHADYHREAPRDRKARFWSSQKSI